VGSNLDRWGTDAEALAASLDDPEHFSAIVDRHFREIFRFVARRVGQEEADDLAAETFATAFGNRRNYDLDRPDSLPWLYGIATNLLRHHRRSEQRRLVAYARAQVVPLDKDEADQLVRRLDAASELAKLALALLEIDADNRDALHLVAVSGLSFDDAATALGVPVGTVHSRVARARSRLRDLLAHTGQYMVKTDPPQN
jgi:RNA polymerase sigma factor (sigma-70 family)